MTDYTPILTDAQIGAVVCDVYKKTGAAEIGELRLKRDAVALGRAVERAAIAAYQRQQWISVEDRLPPDDETWIYAMHIDGVPEIVCGCLIHETFPDRAYSHWMPLPPPPETQS